MTEEKSAAEQAAEAPDVATSGATEPVGSVEVGELDKAQQEHLERRTEPRLPDPGQAVGNSADFHKDPEDQLASDGDQVREGLPEENKGTDA